MALLEHKGVAFNTSFPARATRESRALRPISSPFAGMRISSNGLNSCNIFSPFFLAFSRFVCMPAIRVRPTPLCHWFHAHGLPQRTSFTKYYDQFLKLWNVCINPETLMVHLVIHSFIPRFFLINVQIFMSKEATSKIPTYWLMQQYVDTVNVS